eukprot:15468966-Alexandrium_andersonii.AAC.1
MSHHLSIAVKQLLRNNTALKIGWSLLVEMAQGAIDAKTACDKKESWSPTPECGFATSDSDFGVSPEPGVRIGSPKLQESLPRRGSSMQPRLWCASTGLVSRCSKPTLAPGTLSWSGWLSFLVCARRWLSAVAKPHYATVAN